MICFLSFSYPVYSELPTDKTYHPFSNSLGFTLEVGGTIPKTDYKIDELSIIGRILIEYFFTSQSSHTFGLRILGGAGILNGQVFSNDIVYPPVPENFNTDFYFFGCGFLYALNIGKSVPYLSVLAAYTSFNPLDENGYQLPNNKYQVYKNGAMLYSFEAGVRFPFSERWSLNLGGNLNFSNTDYLDDVKAGSNNDTWISFFTGLSYYIHFNNDADCDGVDDDMDLCPDTPEGINVDEFGCSNIDLSFYKALYDSSKDIFISNGIFTDSAMFCFQVEILKDIQEARLLKNKIDFIGYPSYIIKINIGNAEWYSVRIGYFNSFESAFFYKNKFYKIMKGD